MDLFAFWVGVIPWFSSNCRMGVGRVPVLKAA